MNLERLLLFILCAVWVCSPVQAQVSEQHITLDLTVSSQLPRYVHDWGASDDNAVLTIANETQDLINAKIDVQVHIGDTLYARTQLFTMPLFQVVPGITTYTAGQIFSTAELELYGNIYGQRNASNTILPAGSYTLCLQLIEEDGSKPLSLPICRPFSIQGALRPTLLYPSRIVDIASTPGELLHFRWELPHAVAPAPTQWILRVVEATTVENDSLAMLNGATVLERTIRDSTHFALATPSEFFATNRRYLWSVRSVESPQAANTTAESVSTAWAIPMPFATMRPDTQQQIDQSK